MTVRQGKKFGFQSAAENLQRRRRPDQLRQTVPDRCSSCWKGAVANGRTHSAWNDQRWCNGLHYVSCLSVCLYVLLGSWLEIHSVQKNWT